MAGVQIFIGTKRGLFIASGDAGRRGWTLSEPLLPGREVYHAFLDPRDGTTAWAATDHPVWGAHVHRSTDRGRTWEVMEKAPHHADDRALKAIWTLAPGPVTRPDELWAGIEPAGLFVSHDRGESWEPVAALNDHATRGTWQAAGGGLALHSIQFDPLNPRRMWCAISAGGVYGTTDGGATWEPMNKGVRADFLPEPYPASGQCVHRLVVHPANPNRLYQQNHCGTYRSDDGGASWVEVVGGLPSNFGYALAVDPANPDAVYVIPEESSDMRAVPEGKLRVYRSRDAGGSWQALRRGLPQDHAWVSVLREGLANDNMLPVGLYFGTSGGHLFASRDAGESWTQLAGYLPRILSVTVAVLE